MATLSEHDRSIIVRHPLGGSLDHLYKSLRDMVQFYGPAVSAYDGHADSSKQDRQRSVSRLLTALMGQEAALDLYSPLSNRNVASELATLLGRLRQDHIDHGHFIPLVKLVTQKASDSEIWSAVLDLITTLTRVTPPASIPATFDSTPITHSSTS